MPLYRKAYRLGELSRFSGWAEKRPGELANDELVFVDENHRVFTASLENPELIFESDTPAWKDFCKNQLGFQVPDFAVEAVLAREQMRRRD